MQLKEKKKKKIRGLGRGVKKKKNGKNGVNGRRPEGAGRGAFYSAGGTARRSFATDLKHISKRILETPAFLGTVVEPSSARRRLIKNRTKLRKSSQVKLLISNRHK